MEVYELVDIEDCPLCGGGALLEEENGSYYIMCLDCGCNSIAVKFKDDDDRVRAAQTTANLWNSGKVIKGTPGE